MNVYSFRDYPENRGGVVYVGTLADAQRLGKELEPVFRPNCRIELLEVPTDKAGVLSILNHGGPHRNMVEVEALRTWTLTQRGGLNELTSGGV